MKLGKVVKMKLAKIHLERSWGRKRSWRSNEVGEEREGEEVGEAMKLEER